MDSGHAGLGEWNRDVGKMGSQKDAGRSRMASTGESTRQIMRDRGTFAFGLIELDTGETRIVIAVGGGF